MKKAYNRLYLIMLVVFLFVFLISCDNGPKHGFDDNGASTDESQFSEQITLNFDLDTVEYKSKLKVYPITYFEVDRESISQTMLKGVVVRESASGEGWIIEAHAEENVEYITFYEGAVKGGFSYGNIRNEKFLPQQVGVVFVEGHPYNPVQAIEKYNTRDEYPIKTDLKNVLYSDSYASILDLFDKLKIPQVILQETRTLNLTTMKDKYNLYTEYIKRKYGEQAEIEARTYMQDDECYYFSFRQIVDGIPVINVSWDEKHLLWEQYPAHRISVYYSASGIESISAQNMITVSGEGDEQPLLSKEDAISTIKMDLIDKYYGSAISIESMELCYLITVSKTGMELCPVWLIYTEHNILWDTVPAIKGDYMVYDAITGKRLQET